MSSKTISYLLSSVLLQPFTNPSPFPNHPLLMLRKPSCFPCFYKSWSIIAPFQGKLLSVVVWTVSPIFSKIPLFHLSPPNPNHYFLPLYWIFSISVICITNKTKFSDAAPATARIFSQKNFLNELSVLVFITPNSLFKLHWNCFSKGYQKPPRQTSVLISFYISAAFNIDILLL